MMGGEMGGDGEASGFRVQNTRPLRHSNGGGLLSSWMAVTRR